MPRRKKPVKHDVDTKRAAVEAVMAGEMRTVVAERYKVVPSAIDYWRKQYTAGQLDKDQGKRKANGAGNEQGLTPQALFTSRVNRAIATLRQAEKEVERMKAQKKIKGPDKAHLLAQLALWELQGDDL